MSFSVSRKPKSCYCGAGGTALCRCPAYIMAVKNTNAPTYAHGPAASSHTIYWITASGFTSFSWSDSTYFGTVYNGPRWYYLVNGTHTYSYCLPNGSGELSYNGYPQPGSWIGLYSFKVASTANVVIASTTAGSVIDGVTLAAGHYVLLKDQTTPGQNGIYFVPSSGSLIGGPSSSQGFYYITSGTANTGKYFFTTSLTVAGPVNGFTEISLGSITGGRWIDEAVPPTPGLGGVISYFAYVAVVNNALLSAMFETSTRCVMGLDYPSATLLSGGAFFKCPDGTACMYGTIDPPASPPCTGGGGGTVIAPPMINPDHADHIRINLRNAWSITADCPCCPNLGCCDTYFTNFGEIGIGLGYYGCLWCELGDCAATVDCPGYPPGCSGNLCEDCYDLSNGTSGTSTQGIGVSISGASNAAIVGVDWSVNLEACSTVLSYLPVGKTTASPGPITVEFSGGDRTVCSVVFGTAADNYGSFGVTIEAWDSKGGYVTSPATLDNSAFTNDCSGGSYLFANAGYGASLTKVKITHTSGSPGNLIIGRMCFCSFLTTDATGGGEEIPAAEFARLTEDGNFRVTENFITNTRILEDLISFRGMRAAPPPMMSLSSAPVRGRCAYLGERTEFRAGCGGARCKHECDHPDSRKYELHMVAVPAENCQTCPDWRVIADPEDIPIEDEYRR